MKSISSKYSTFVKLGSNRDLSKLELSVLCEKLDLTEVSFHEWKDYLILDLEKNKKSDFLRYLPNTGSLVKAGFINFVSKSSEEDKWKDHLTKLLTNKTKRFTQKSSKQIKISLCVQSSSKEITSHIYNLSSKIITKFSKEKEIQIKLLHKKDATFEITPFQFHKENIDRRGFEITILAIKTKLYFGVTQWVTNPLEDIKKDEERKVRFFTHGTSIKLARTMIFLARSNIGETLLDPFCGTGTILVEGISQKMRVIGIDNDVKCFRASKENLNQYSMQFPSSEKMKDKWNVLKKDSRDLESIPLQEISAIITEPYLGPFLKELPVFEVAEKTMRSLEKTYIKVLKAGTKKLKKGSKVIFIIPEYHYSSDQIISPDLNNISERSNLKLVENSQYFHVKLPVSIGRKHNIINRKLAIFTKESD